MVKFINHWMFASRLWHDAKPTPVAINLHNVIKIEPVKISSLGGNLVAVYLNNEDNLIPIEGDIIEILAEFQKHLINQY